MTKAGTGTLWDAQEFHEHKQIWSLQKTEVLKRSKSNKDQVPGQDIFMMGQAQQYYFMIITAAYSLFA